MKTNLITLCTVFCCLACVHKENLELWYRSPAKTWTDALPVGNGRLGGMIYGDFRHENIQLNEESVWAGSNAKSINPPFKPGEFEFTIV